jgi:D-lyxose ketol-isomerase
MQFFQSFVEKIRKTAQDQAAETDKFTAQQILRMSGILLSAEFKSARIKSSKVSAWNLFQSDMKSAVPDHIRCPTQSDGLRHKFTGEYAKMVAEQWPEHRDEYMEKADVINRGGNTLTKVPLGLHQKRTVKKLTELVCDGGAHHHRV